MPSLVINVGTRKKPWENVPIEVLIEFERKKHERLKDRREQLRVPSFGYHPFQKDEGSAETEEEFKIVIDFS